MAELPTEEELEQKFTQYINEFMSLSEELDEINFIEIFRENSVKYAFYIGCSFIIILLSKKLSRSYFWNKKCLELPKQLSSIQFFLSGKIISTKNKHDIYYAAYSFSYLSPIEQKKLWNDLDRNFHIHKGSKKLRTLCKNLSEIIGLLIIDFHIYENSSNLSTEKANLLSKISKKLIEIITKKAKKITTSHLSEQLHNIGLTFLSIDLDSIRNDKISSSHIYNYLKEISDADTNNPEALYRIILGDETNQIHAVRALLIGPGGAGKSSLADRLQGIPFDSKPKNVTLGIEYLNHQPLDLQKTFPETNPEKKDLNLYLWDFGGQTIFHGLHRAFLHENCVYVLVVDSRHEQAPDEWLHQIRHLAGSNVTVLLITNQHDGCDIRQNEKRLLREFPNLLDNNSFHYFSCIEPDSPGLKYFINNLTKAALDSQRIVWKETLNIHQAIRTHTENTSSVFIATTQIKQIIKDNGRVEDSEAMINSLEQLGFLAKITKGGLSYCLKPEWAVDHAYELLYSGTLRKTKGKLNPLDFDECFEQTPTPDQLEKLLAFLNDRSLCFELPDSGHYFSQMQQPPMNLMKSPTCCNRNNA
ncbi:MAG: COR domain-containing protein [Thiolinea sp.]